MDVSCSASLLLAPNTVLPRKIPQNVLQILRRVSNPQYLDTLSRLALEPAYTTTIFTSHEPLSVEICSRWLPAPETDDLSALAALARILPSAPHLSVYATTLLKRGRGALRHLTSQSVTSLGDLPLAKLEKLLLALCRLLRFDNKTFASSVSPAQLQVLLRHVNPYIKYLAVRILCLYLYASDAALETMIRTYIGEGEIAGRWEDKTIDYTFFSLWEEKRLKDLASCFQMCRHAFLSAEQHDYSLTGRRIIETQDFSVTVACIGGVLVPRLDGQDVAISSLVKTETTSKNMRLIADGIRSSKPLLVTGPTGIGKSSIIRDIARELGKGSSMITLHLNEQTDAKLLIGMYTSAKTPSSFSWRPGVLTTAVLEGRWVLIEDLERAPTEIISTLLPLLERRELLVPNWGECVRAAPAFKLIATVRSGPDIREKGPFPTLGMMGLRHWLHIPLDTPPDEELAKIIVTKFPLLHAHIPRFMSVYQLFKHQNTERLVGSVANNVRRPIGPQDLLRWCGRVQDLLFSAGITSGHQPISDTISDHIFLEAVDCFVGSCPTGPQKSNCIDIIARNLHMPAERARYCLNGRKPQFKVTDSTLRIGRITLGKQKKPPGFKTSSSSGSSPFAAINHVARLLESVAAAVKQAEPSLLVGETGTGKTTIVQRLADAMDRKLTVVNLSQQSETGDLLGGYKPLNLRSLAIPMKEEFDELLGLTSNSNKNQFYIDALGKSVTQGRWSKALVLWQNALRRIDDRFNPGGSEMTDANEEPQSKKRRLDPKLRKLKSRWDKFASDVQVFQKHLASGSKGFAFSFVESNIVRAARNGEWVLLDEINLASPDTLESLADLFSPTTDGGPSILLIETGDTERIYAHENFRIFAAMNPATDIGKRNLPANLRSKFTELFVEAPDKDLEDLTSVVKTYLGGHSHTDVRASTDIARLYLDIQKLASENRLVDGANQKPHFSFRTLTRTLIYFLDIAPMYGLRRAIFEGFSMSFLTILNKESELLLLPLLEKHIFSEQKNSKSSLYQTPRLPSDGKPYVQFKHYCIAQGANSIEKQPHYIITPFIEHNLLSLVRATSTRRFPVLLQGPTSSGKTSMVEYLARISGNKFVRINNHEHTDLQEYLGTYVSGLDGRLRYQDGILVHALREGYWVVLDELNLAPTDVLEALNRLLDDNKELLIPETQQIVKPHENFMLFATQNPPGMYGGRKVLSRAFRNRFLELHFDDIPENELETILRERSQIAPSFCTRIVAVYKKLSILRQSDRLFEQKNSFATLRDLFRWALRDADDREQLAVNGFLLLAERVRNQEERLAVKAIIEDVMKVKIDEDKIYGPLIIEELLRAQHSSSRDVVWTKSMRRLCILVYQALKNNEPVLLVGETGSGKTTICQFIAEMTGTKLHSVNAHQNMETSDLIGAQRPVRNKAHAELQLSRELIAVLKQCNAWGEDQAYDIPELLKTYDNLDLETRQSLTEQQRLAIESGRAKVNSLFEWADGSLVTAMRGGEYFLLDEISLADDSVLERLNSVLEPGRTLFLAEKGTSDEPLEAAPGFQFLATMNPGGDYGKRELSPALRNRFTEIWVPNASSEEEILEIIQAKLPPHFLIFSKPMVAFAAWYSATYNISVPHISIRDMLSWVQFINKFQCPNSHVSLLHGAAMVFVDGLGANLASKSSIAESSILEERLRCISKLEELFSHDMSSIYHGTYRPCSSDQIFSIGPFSLTKAPGARQDSGYSLQAPTTMANAMRIVRALQLRKPVLTEGSPGVGKTTLVAALAHAIGMPLTRINLSDQTDLMDLFGSDVPVEGVEAGHFAWRDAPFLRAMQKGEWVLLDEMNLASQSVLEGLNACLDHRGQVYISELDCVFARHPNFIVFAAQNPYHQGGGRKGLPASFVNRFTVVYADSFTPEDLMLISKEIYPTASDNDRQNIVHSVTALNRMLQENRIFGAHGGPWEINLRDVLRWLQLVTAPKGLVTFASPAQHAQLLLLQRFRTPEDVTAISEVLERKFPHNPSRNYYHGKCKTLFEIGMGLLPRDCMSQPISGNAFSAAKTNLPVAESAMLCVHYNWPCLLVGASVSGKSNLIFQLASSAGADLVEIPLNPEMDTMDLVGGYEQADPQREIFDFISRLREHTRQIMTCELETMKGFDDELVTLEAQLQSPEPSLTAVLQCMEDVPGSEFMDFLAEGHNLLRKSKVDNRARFEWIDGILVKAMRRGKWVILDNANLCNPSVLDRLNSLLEPNGFLSINEHRTRDGSAEIVHPHKDFRLFMTMDPRHGELSRAMRNRSIELFMPAKYQSPSFEILGSTYESTISRFGLFQNFDWIGFGDESFKTILTILLDHLSRFDFERCAQWEAQIKRGLMGMLVGEKGFLVSSIVETYRLMMNRNGSTLRGISDAYERIGAQLSFSASEFASMQAIHPSNNPHLLASTDQNSPESNLRWLGCCFDVLLGIYSYLQDLKSIDQRLYSEEETSPWTPLENSMLSLRTASVQDATTQPIATFLQEMGIWLRSTMEGGNFMEIEDQEGTLIFVQDTIAYLRDMLDLAHSQDFDGAAFQTYLAIGRSMVAGANVGGNAEHLVAALARELASGLDTFNLSWQLSSGKGMEKLWGAFKPNTAMNMSQLENSLLIKDLADRFDTLKFSSGASVHDMEKLQESLVQMHDVTGNGSWQECTPLTDVREALEYLESQFNVSNTGSAPYFQSQFESCYQYSIGSDKTTSGSSSLLRLLSGRSTRELMNFGSHTEGWKLLSQLQQMTATIDPSMALASIRGILPISMLQKLGNISEVPLQSLELLHTEIDAAAQNMAKLMETMQEKPLNSFLQLLRELQEKLQQALASPNHTDIRANVRQLINQSGGNSGEESWLNGRVEYLCSCLESTSNIKTFEATSTSAQRYEECGKAALNCIQFFTGCLLLYVPDRPFDPALRPTIERSRHKKRTEELEVKLGALQDIENVFSGQKSSYRIERIEQDLEALGAEPQVPSIARPSSSELTNMQSEYNNVLSMIVLRSPNDATLQSMFQGQQPQIQEVKLIRANIGQAVERLAHGYHAYEDITKPLIAMLQGLDIGLTLAQLASHQSDCSKDTVKHLSGITPLLAATPANLTTVTLTNLQTLVTDQPDLRLHSLEFVALERSIGCDTDPRFQTPMFQAFHRLYEEWKQQLDQGQQQNVARSSLYRYRGSEEGSDEMDEQDFRHLFPTVDDPSEEVNGFSRSNYDPRQQAQRVAQLQMDLFQTTRPTSERILRLLQSASQTIAGLWQDQSPMSKSPVPAEKMLPALILSLEDNKERLHGKPRQEHHCNFYTDANISEAQRFVQLVCKIQSTFTELQEAWPEHATLGDVLRISSELLAFRHTEPVAKLLTKAEQLHVYVHEWQVVASKQYTAITLYDQLTELLVSWRRLELSTWARLLDMEDQKCYDDAGAWWFIAYENIIAAPLSLINNGDHVGPHTEHLFNTLSDFLTSTSMGQYTHQLRMINCFHSYLELLEKSIPAMSVVRNAVMNFISYYSRFEDPIRQSLRTGRQSLEKDMKEILLLASWTDTNVIALRDSARRSHHKLFKVVRKYRSLLAQASNTVIGQGVPPQLGPVDSLASESPVQLPQLAAVDVRAFQICQRHLINWQSKPERFTNAAVTAERMQSMSKLPSNAIDAASYLTGFGSDLSDSIRSLRKETPLKATKENSKLIKHLKVRKRKLYVDTLKAVRQMGFRSNVNADVLAKQDSLAVVLTNSPILGGGPCENDLKAAEYHFHTFLNIMPQAKERARNHSEDLTHGEVARSLGYLESTLSMVLKQRRVLANGITQIEILAATMRQIQNLWAPESYSVRKRDPGKAANTYEVRYVSRWLPAIIEAGSVIIEKHGKLGSTDPSPILEDLSTWKDSILAVLRVFDCLPDLPMNLASSQHEQVALDAEALLQNFKAHLQVLIDRNPDMRFVLGQVQLWANPRTPSIDQNMEEQQTPDLTSLDDHLSSTVDSILVAVQRVQEASSILPTSDKDSAWLMHTEESLDGGLKGLSEVNTMLKDMISKIRHLGSAENSDLSVAGALCATAMPIVQQYRNIQEAALVRYFRLHRSLCELASVLASAFSDISLNGFCSPVQNLDAETGKAEKLEGGTGLGEGEGAEDISKDIQGDEDISELAQERNKDSEKEDIETREDAVDMDHDELEGEIVEGSEKGEDDGSASEGGDKDEIDEQTGSVDDLDPSDVDEKLWDGKAEDTEKEKKRSKARGKAEDDEQVAAESAGHQDNATKDETEDNDEINEEGAEEGEKVAKEETEKMDPHAREGQNLDLPEEMDLDSIDGKNSEQGSGDSDMDGMSDMEEAHPGEDMADQRDDEAEGELLDEAAEGSQVDLNPTDEDGEVEGQEVAESPVDTELSEDGREVDDQGILQDRSDDAAVDLDNAAPSDARGLGEGLDQQDVVEQASSNQDQANKGDKRGASDQDDSKLVAKDGEPGPSNDQSDENQAQDSAQNGGRTNQAFKKLGDALEKWHRQNKQIRDAAEQDACRQPPVREDGKRDEEFEHLQHEDMEWDTQALGAATEEQARALDDQALDSEMPSETRDFPPEEINHEAANDNDQVMDDVDAVKDDPSKTQPGQSRPGAFVADGASRRLHDQQATTDIENEEEIKNLDVNLSSTHLHPPDTPRIADEARRLWLHHESLTRDLSLTLTEQLRLILAPTLATKMRGDFRTGKRLNIKRVIPYIASNYKRDKIWMRRTIPSKRNYQIMLAVDDSKSMLESGGSQLAFSSLALVAKSLSMLEVGEICVVGFGNGVHVAHEFGTPFSSDAGAQIFQYFTFQQTKTNVRKLVADSISLFRSAKSKTFNAGTDLWQLELIISDGVCEDHETIRRLVRQAQDERIMIVFVIVDAVLKGKGESIVDMSEAVFEPDEKGETKLVIRRYLDGFPFVYYVVVGDVRDLPGVLSQALRGWFREVVECG